MKINGTEQMMKIYKRNLLKQLKKTQANKDKYLYIKEKTNINNLNSKI